MVLKLEWPSETPGGLVKTQITESPPPPPAPANPPPELWIL